MAFDVAADAYDRFMGRFSDPLADALVDLLDPQPGQRALDVGCGPGAVTERLVGRLGAAAVKAIDPSAPFVDAVRARCPGVDVRSGVAEALPFPDDSVDVAVSQLVVLFMSDPVAGLREMARVTRPGGLVAANVWDVAGGRSPIAPLWQAARDLDPGVDGDTGLAVTSAHELAGVFDAAGLGDLSSRELEVVSSYRDVDEWWQPLTLGVGPAGDFVARLEPDARRALEARCRELLPAGPFDVRATAWVVVARP
jgi:SAM-dependent methyltransferase